jgi:hypothetical protein
VLRVTCAKCERAGRYRLARLIEARGRDAKLVDWLGEITAGAVRRYTYLPDFVLVAFICKGT